MEQIKSSDLHRTPGGKNGFYSQLLAVVQCTRQHLAELKGNRKRDTSASGAIHALALLANEVSARGLPISQHEVDYWQEIFSTWFQSAKRHFPGTLGDEFREKAELDFRLIREKAESFSHVPWEQIKDRYELPIRLTNRETFDRASEAAKVKYPTELGRALDKYLVACVDRLLSNDDLDAPLVVKAKEPRTEDSPGSVAPRFVTFGDGMHSIIVTTFGGLTKPCKSGLGLQNAVKRFLKKNYETVLEKLQFDSESSMFCARSNCLQSLGVVSEAIYTIAASAKTSETS